MELEPCLFCGGEANLAGTEVDGNIATRRIWVQCNSCNAEGSKETSGAKAIAAWNTRKGHSVPVERTDLGNLMHEEAERFGNDLPLTVSVGQAIWQDERKPMTAPITPEVPDTGGLVERQLLEFASMKSFPEFDPWKQAAREAVAELFRLKMERDEAINEAHCCDDINLDQPLADIISDLQADRERLSAELKALTFGNPGNESKK